MNQRRISHPVHQEIQTPSVQPARSPPRRKLLQSFCPLSLTSWLWHHPATKPLKASTIHLHRPLFAALKMSQRGTAAASAPPKVSWSCSSHTNPRVTTTWRRHQRGKERLFSDGASLKSCLSKRKLLTMRPMRAAAVQRAQAAVPLLANSFPLALALTALLPCHWPLTAAAPAVVRGLKTSRNSSPERHSQTQR